MWYDCAFWPWFDTHCNVLLFQSGHGPILGIFLPPPSAGLSRLEVQSHSKNQDCPKSCETYIQVWYRTKIIKITPLWAQHGLAARGW
jgi:hypothetical protein